MKEKKGISLIVLIVTIIVMIIIAGAVIISLTETNIIDQAETATKNWNISTIKEQIDIKNALRQGGIEGEYLGKVENGTLKELGIEGTNWDNKLIIQNGNLVYRPEMVTDKEVTELTNMGIAAGNYIGVVNTSNSFTNYQSTTNLITADNLDDTINADTDATIYILEDITLPADYATITRFDGILDGMNNTISGVTTPLVNGNYGSIKNITVEGSIDYIIFSGVIVEGNWNLIYNCHNKVKILDGMGVAGISYFNAQVGKIINSSNQADLMGSGNDYIIGITVDNEGLIYNSFNSGNLIAASGTAIDYMAGITGYSNGTVKNCYNTGNIESEMGLLNGLVRYGKVENSYNIGDVTNTNAFCAIGTIKEPNNVYSKKIDGSTDRNNIGCWIEELYNDSDGDTTITANDKVELLKKLNEGNSTNIWVEDTNNINSGFPILYWQVEN